MPNWQWYLGQLSAWGGLGVLVHSKVEQDPLGMVTGAFLTVGGISVATYMEEKHTSPWRTDGPPVTASEVVPTVSIWGGLFALAAIVADEVDITYIPVALIYIAIRVWMLPEFKYPVGDNDD